MDNGLLQMRHRFSIFCSLLVLQNRRQQIRFSLPTSRQPFPLREKKVYLGNEVINNTVHRVKQEGI